jgi:chromosome segregation ATPase
MIAPQSMAQALAEVDRLRSRLNEALVEVGNAATLTARLRAQLDEARAELGNVGPLLTASTETQAQLVRLMGDYRAERDTAEALVEELREENAQLRCRIEELGGELKT